MSDSPLNEAKALDMLGLKTKVVGTRSLSSRRRQQAAVSVEPHIINAHARGVATWAAVKGPEAIFTIQIKLHGARTGQGAILDWESPQ